MIRPFTELENRMFGWMVLLYSAGAVLFILKRPHRSCGLRDPISGLAGGCGNMCGKVTSNLPLLVILGSLLTDRLRLQSVCRSTAAVAIRG